MKTIVSYCQANRLRLFTAFAIVAGLAFGLIDTATAALGGLIVCDTAPVDEILKKALGEHGLALKDFAGRFEKSLEKHGEKMVEHGTRLLELEQKLARRPTGPALGSGGPGELTDLILKSDGLAAFTKGVSAKVDIPLPYALVKTAILNATGLDQPLVPPDYRPGISFAPNRRLMIRDLFSSVPTSSNMVTFARELAFTSNAGPQYEASPATTEGAVKRESALAFELANAPIVTIAHWIPASRQVLEDAPMLTQYVENRLLYGAKLEEEREMLLGAGAVGELDGLIHQATAFSGAGTGLTALDTVATGIAQLVSTGFTPSGVVLSPTDWFSSSFVLAKTTYGEYLLGDPQSATAPRLWGIPAVISPSMTAGKFLALDAQRTGYIADREEANMRISESHADFFIRNLCALLLELRLALIVEQRGAMIYGSL